MFYVVKFRFSSDFRAALAFLRALLDKFRIVEYNIIMQCVYKKTYVDCVEEVRKTVASLPVDLDHPKIILVPEVYTFDFEREFYSVGGGSFDIKVRSVSKLYYDLVPENTAIGRQTAIALVRKIAIDKKDELVYYRAAFDKRGFAAKVYETLEKLAGSNISPEELCSSDAALERKISDLRLIYKEYASAVNGKRADSNGRVSALTDYIAAHKTEIAGSDVFVVNFDVFTALQKKLLQAIDGVARSLTVFYSEMQTDYLPKKKPVVYAATSSEDEYSRIADFVSNDVYSGYRFGDISVLGENIDYDRLKRAFDSRDVRFYFDKKRSLASSEPADLILRICACCCDGNTADNLIALASNRLVVPDTSERDAFIAYLREHNAFFSAVFDKFDDADEKGALAENARKKVTSFLACPTRNNFLTSAEFSQNFLSAIELAKSGINEDNERYFTLTETALQTIKEVFGEKEYRFRDLFSAFSELASGTEVSVVPNKTDTVFVGPLNARRGFLCKKLYIIGFNDGVLPKTDPGNGLLGDLDADKLTENGLEISPLSRDANERFRDELVQLVKTAEKLNLSYVSDGENKRSYMLRLIEHACNMKETDEITSDAIDYAEQELKPSAIARLYPTKKSCLMRAAAGDERGAYSSIAAAVETDCQNIINDLKPPVDSLSDGIKIESCSASLLQTYFDCPKKFFYKYALGVEKAKDGSVQATDIGTVLHKIIERFVRIGKFDRPEKIGALIADEELEKAEKYSLDCNARLKKYIRRDAIALCSCVAREFKEGEFVPLGEEVRYGDPGESKELGIAPGGTVMCGQIDRVDAYGNAVRVVDYKSGAKVELTANDIYFGKKLQLPIYSLVMKKRGYNPVGMFYFPVNDSKNAGVLCGMLINDPLYINAMDKKSPENKSDVFDYDPAAKTPKTLVSEEIVESVIKYAYAVSEKAIEGIKSGFIAAVPTSSGQNGACSYCDYAVACHGKKCERKITGAKYDDIIKAVKDGTDE